MNDFPDWLPTIASIDGPIDDVHSRLYRAFLDAFRDDRCLFEDLPVRWDSRFVPGRPYDEGYWHMVSRIDRRTNVRTFDPKRAERLPWCAAMILNSNQRDVLVWNYRPGGKRERTYCWLEKHDYVVAMEYRQRPDGSRPSMYLVTAYHLDGQRSRNTFRNQYEKGTRR